jgi:CHASE2 domain-containing sensor protein
MKKFLFKRDNFLATIAVFLVIYLLELIAINWDIFNPFVQAFKDFELTDMYFSKLNTKTFLDTNVIIVNAENLSREEIAKQLTIINKYHPKVIGVDLFFKDKKDTYGDSLLSLALHENKNTVLPYSINTYGKEGKPSVLRINPIFGTLYSGYIDLCGDLVSTVREFYPFRKFNNDTYISFDAKIIELYDLNAFHYLEKRNRLKERINYIGNVKNFIYIDPTDVINHSDQLSIIKDKIVLLGYFNYPDNRKGLNADDLHFTPLNPRIGGHSFPDMNGITIHANIISMIINKNYINVMSGWLSFLIAFFLCYFYIAFLIHVLVHGPKWLHFFSQITQLIVSVIILLIVFYVFRLFHYRIESTLPITAMILSVHVLYFYNGFVIWLNQRYHFKTYLLH